MANSERLPLENVGQERAVLGCLIGDLQTFWTVRDRVKPDRFVSPIHQTIVKALHTLADLNRSFSIPAIVSRMPPGEDDFNPDSYVAMLVSSDAEPEDISDNLDDLESMWQRRRMMEIGQLAIKIARENDGEKTESEKLDMLSGMFDSASDQVMSGGIRNIHDIAMGVVAEAQDALDADKVIGLDIGLAKLQELIGPLLPQTLYLLAGSPGSGKTALAEQIAHFVARNEPVYFASLEMPDKHIARRHLSRQTNIKARDITRAAISYDQLGELADVAYDLRPSKLYVDSQRDMTVAKIRAKAMRMKRQKGLSLLILDHVLYLKAPEAKMDVVASIRPNLRSLKKLSVDLNIPVVALTQLSADFDKGPWSLRRPQNGDLFGGSGVQQEVDNIVFINRFEYTLSQRAPDKSDKTYGDWQNAMDEWRGRVEFLMRKNRDDVGATSRTGYFEAERTTFHDHPPADFKPLPLLGMIPEGHSFT